MCARCVVLAHLEPQNTRSPFSIQRAASPLITKYIVRGRSAGSRLLRFLRRPCTPFTVTVMDEWGSCRDMPGIKQQQSEDIGPRARAHPATATANPGHLVRSLSLSLPPSRVVLAQMEISFNPPRGLSASGAVAAVVLL